MTPRVPVWRRAMPSSSRSSSSGSMRTFESEPMHSPMPRCSDARDRQEAVAEVRLGRRADADPRAGVARAGRARLRRHGLRARPSSAGRGSLSRASSSIGRRPCSARHSSISRGCSSAWTCSGRSCSAAYAAELLAARRPGRHARSGGRRRRGRPAPRSSSSCAQVLGDRLLTEPRAAAAQVAA